MSEEKTVIEPEVIDESSPDYMKPRKKSLGSKIAETFITGDMDDVKSYVIKQIIVPRVKQTVEDIITNGIHILFNGSGSVGSSNNRKNNMYVSYDNSGYVDYSSAGKRTNQSVSTYTGSFGNFIYPFRTRQEADEIISMLGDVLEAYKKISIKDYYDILMNRYKNLKVQISITDPNYGWKSMDGITVKQTYDRQYYIQFPRTVPLN